MNLSNRVKGSERDFSENANKELRFLWRLLIKQYDNTMDYFKNNNVKNITKALDIGDRILAFSEKYEKNHIKRLKKGKCSVQTGMIFVELVGVYTRISNRLSNIAERIPEIQKHYYKLD